MPPKNDPRYYDALETRDAEVRERALFATLPAHIEWAQQKSSFYADTLTAINPQEVTTRPALAALPLTRKSDLVALQQSQPPFGGLDACDTAHCTRLFASPGPIYEFATARPDYWRMARALYAAGARAGQLVHNTFAYHFTPAGAMVESGAHALGCAVFAAGTGQSELQSRTISATRPSVYAGTPSFLDILFERGTALELDMTSLRTALVSGEALTEEARARHAQHGLCVRQCYATAECGLIGYESEACAGLILDEAVILEIVRVGTGDVAPPGEVGEVVVTILNPDYPLIRFATGDLSAVLPGVSTCGRTNTRLRGWLGRADQAAKVRGMFVRPEQIAEIVRRYPQIARARLVIAHDSAARDVMVLRCERAGGDAECGGESDGGDQDLREAVVTTLRDILKLRGTVEWVALGSLPDDGKVIDDTRVVTDCYANVLDEG